MEQTQTCTSFSNQTETVETPCMASNKQKNMIFKHLIWPITRFTEFSSNSLEHHLFKHPTNLKILNEWTSNLQSEINKLEIPLVTLLMGKTLICIWTHLSIINVSYYSSAIVFQCNINLVNANPWWICTCRAILIRSTIAFECYISRLWSRALALVFTKIFKRLFLSYLTSDNSTVFITGFILGDAAIVRVIVVRR